MIEIRICEMGEDRVFLVTGGTAHIGATATAYMGEDGDVLVDVTTLPGHRERELAAELAMQAASALGRTIAVLVGIHLDKPTKQEIADIVEEARLRMAEVLMRNSAT